MADAIEPVTGLVKHRRVKAKSPKSSDRDFED